MRRIHYRIEHIRCAHDPAKIKEQTEYYEQADDS